MNGKPTRVRFVCRSLVKEIGSHSSHGAPEYVYNVKFRAIHDNWRSEENKRFFAVVPAGEIVLKALREETFIPGLEYYVDFTPVEMFE